ncbi:MAG: type II and III secretion system protein family protein [Xanthobacteraceae bacterium]|nr:type II and III secretion system protein family protein [Xanthobacteraceae bacterium]MBX3549364.1 type II and III secretion system protein family protein [Xanthobacteraceae bacterium]MCW5678943.1 type II and III secretion system protein family protein [Xanthobacteraceae bacterium]
MQKPLAAKAGLTIAFLAALIAVALLPEGLRAAEPQLVAPPPAATQQRPQLNAPVVHTRAGFLPLGVGKSVVIDLPRDAKDVLIANPAIANAVIRSARRAYLIGVKAGQTNIVFFDGEGQQIAAYDIEVAFDTTGVRAAVQRLAPSAQIKVDAIGDSVVLSGSVASAAEAQHIFDTAARLVGDPAKVVNGLTIRDREQILLKVTVAEVQRNILKQLGVDLNGASVNIGSAVVNFTNNNPFSAQNQTLSNSAITPTLNLPNGGTVSATLRAMEQAGIMRTLAEPNLTAISGESAKFLAGGEFPIPAGQSCDPTTGCQIQIQFKQFGVALEFTPVVLSEGKISLRVSTEVSELSSEGAIRLATVTIPALRVRRANSTVELPSGGSLVMAGLLQEQTKQNLNGLPGLMNLPVLGALFKSRDYLTGQTELMIMVTPYVVKPNAPQALVRPDDGFANPSDQSTVLLGRLNRIYGVPGANEPKRLKGDYGFILD